ncbi:MAG: hypothetical protein HQL29_03125 [Candidatus Omnitrophica bacterium]|nr:hypothetical protein [Candidatus Omnitrophota bacterium]
MGKTYKNHSCTCPACGEQIEVEEYFHEEEVINCEHCYAELVVTSLKPPKVKLCKSDDDDDDNNYHDDDYFESNDDD